MITTLQPPPQYAQYRESVLPRLDQFPELERAWDRSRQTLQRLREILAELRMPDEVQTIYVCGSLGRMEQVSRSDCDLVIVTDETCAPDSPRSSQIFSDIWRRVELLGLERPKANGIFSQTVTREQLVDSETLGLVDEDQCIYGKRIQLLLDAQPVYRDENCRQLMRYILRRFQLPQMSGFPVSLWSGLRSELVRYYHALRVRTLWIPQSEPGRWRLLNTKLRFSRYLLVAGLLTSLDRSTEDCQESITQIAMSLNWTPLERVAVAVEQDRPADMAEILDAYDSFLAAMNDDEFVQRLANNAASHEIVSSAIQPLFRLSDKLQQSVGVDL